MDSEIGWLPASMAFRSINAVDIRECSGRDNAPRDSRLRGQASVPKSNRFRRSQPTIFRSGVIDSTGA